MSWSYRRLVAYIGIPVLAVVVFFGAIFFTQGSISGADIEYDANYTVGDQIDKELSVSTTVSQDNDHSDGSVRYLYAKHFVLDGGQVVDDSSWKQLSSQSYSHEFSNTYSSTGDRVYVVVLAKAESEFDRQRNAWTEYDITTLERQDYAFSVERAPAPPSPDKSLSSWFSSLITSIFEVFGW